MPAQGPNVPVPGFEVLINGSALSAVEGAHVVHVSVEQATELPDIFSLEIVASDELDDQFMWVDDEGLFPVGGSVEVKLGYADQLASLFKGEITGLEPSFAAGRAPTLVVRGYDRRHRLARGRNTRSFVKKKDSDIATQIAGESNLNADVTDSGLIHDYVLQANQTDFEFLLERARRINYEVVVEDKTLSFRPVANDRGAEVSLAADSDLFEFRPRLSAAGQVSEVAVRGWDPKNKKAIVGKSQSGDEVSKMGGKQAGAALSRRAFGGATGALSRTPVASQAEADRMAVASLNGTALELITGEAACDGSTSLRPGKVVEITGAGKRFSGLYYVTAVAHVITGEGYTTRFSFRRNAL
jgi:phage protein D